MPLTDCTIAGQSVQRYLLTNAQGVQVELMSYGATVVSVAVPQVDGVPLQISRGLASPADYADNPAYMGAICGRFAGRIAHGRFNLDGERVALSQNAEGHHLHGGFVGFSGKHWDSRRVVEAEAVGVDLHYVSAHGEEGYPGRLDCHLAYRLDDESRLTITYRAEVSAMPTVVNLTNHCYWNLSSAPDIYAHTLQLPASEVLAFDQDTLPTGEVIAVGGSAFDFTTPRVLGEQMQALPEQALGFDHCFVNKPRSTEAVQEVARLRDPASGREMSVSSDQPALVLYTGNYLDGSAQVGSHRRHAALCLECQQYSDAPNHAGFPSTVVHPRKPYEQTTIYQFFQD